MISVTELRSGAVFEERGDYYLVISYEHIKMGRGSGNVKVKVRNLTSGATVERSYITGARVQDVSMIRKKMQFLYRDGAGFHFMDMESYEQFDLSVRLIGDYDKFLKENMEVSVMTINDKPVTLELPKNIDYKVVQTGGSAKGNTVGASYKDALLENGLNVKVPLFIKNDEVIRVDTRTGDYVERAK